jgi:hypothetical protein
MSLIKFPSHVKPARVTVQLHRVDETIASPLTNIQQVVSRGNPAWRWTYEFNDLSESERDTVQAFLLNCRGSLNAFKVHDPGEYTLRGSMSNWIDIYSGYGSFTEDGGSDGSQNISSWFLGNTSFNYHFNEDRSLRIEHRAHISALSMSWKGHGGVTGRVDSYAPGKSYVQRVKTFQHPNKVPRTISFAAGSGGGYAIQSQLQVNSTDSITGPFQVGEINSATVLYTVDWTTGNGVIGDAWEAADYRLMRCVLVSNSENLMTRSNDFGHADWLKVGAAVSSGFADRSPTGVTSGSWKLFAPTLTNTAYYIHQTYTKINTEDFYTASVYARAAEMGNIQLHMQSQGAADSVAGRFYLNSGTVSAQAAGLYDRPFVQMWPVGSDYYRCQITALVSSSNQLQVVLYIASGDSLTYSGTGSDGVEIMGLQVRKSPYMGHYVPTTDTVVVGSTWQTGSRLYVDGFDAEDVVKAGQRFEIVNRFNNVNSNYFERTEFKRITKEAKANREGSAILEFDPPIRNAPVPDRSWRQQQHLGETLHNPVIFHKPEMKARLINGTIQYIDKPLKMTDIVFDVMEDLAE